MKKIKSSSMQLHDQSTHAAHTRTVVDAALQELAIDSIVSVHEWPSSDERDARLKGAVAHANCAIYLGDAYVVDASADQDPKCFAATYNKMRASIHAALTFAATKNRATEDLLYKAAETHLLQYAQLNDDDEGTWGEISKIYEYVAETHGLQTRLPADHSSEIARCSDKKSVVAVRHFMTRAASVEQHLSLVQ